MKLFMHVDPYGKRSTKIKLLSKIDVNWFRMLIFNQRIQMVWYITSFPFSLQSIFISFSFFFRQLKWGFFSPHACVVCNLPSPKEERRGCRGSSCVLVNITRESMHHRPTGDARGGVDFFFLTIVIAKQKQY